MTAKPVQERSRKIRTSAERTCMQCGRRIECGSSGWYANSREAGYRCASCGPHPAGGAAAAPGPVKATRRDERPAEDPLQSLARWSGRSLNETWQLLYVPPANTPTAPGRPGPLTERYRPRTLEELRGQPAAVRALRRLAAAPYPCPLLFEGPTGTGKTSAARALAGALGCGVELDAPELGGLTSIASGEQTADAVRDLCGRLWMIPMYGSGWKVAVVNEADRISHQAETVWLDRLEELPPRTLIIFTTNQPEKLTRRLRDRCTRISFDGSAVRLWAAAEELAAMVWWNEIGGPPEAEVILRVVDAAIEDAKLSFRRVVQGVAWELLTKEDQA